jgi:hypothetical protein
MSESQCIGMCLSAADIGVPEAGDVIAYPHPECPEHGDPAMNGPELETCSPGEDETARYVRWEDVNHAEDRG